MVRFQVSILRFVLVAAMLAVAFPGPRVSAGQVAPPPAEPRVIEIMAKRYAYEPSEVAVTQGETVRLLVRSGDGPHGFEIKQLKVKKELLRGAPPVAIEFTADAPGRYPILCSEFCGDGHGGMKGMLVVNTRPEVP